MKKFFIEFLLGEILRGEITKGSDVADYVLKQGALLNLGVGYLTDIAVEVQQKENIHGVINFLTALYDSCDTSKERVASFSRVGFKQFKEASTDMGYSEDEIKAIYNSIKLPTRATSDSAGYDIITPFDICLQPGETAVISTGLRCAIKKNWFLGVYPKSGLGFKFRAQLDNTVGIIDSDYFYSDNEGHIMVKITNDSKSGKVLEVPAGKAICQGIFHEYGITTDDCADGIRNGGFGSTGK